MSKKALNLKKLFKMCAMTVFGLAIFLTFVPIILPFVIFFYVIYSIGAVLIKLRHGNSATRATGMDVLSGKETEDSYPIINVAMCYKGKLDLKKMQCKILNDIMNSYDEKGQRLYKRLTQIYIKSFGYYIWKDTFEFNIEDHVKIITKEDLGLKGFDEENDFRCETLLKLILNKYGAAKIQHGIPQWQLLLFEENEERYTGLFRFHHSIADGVYVSRMLCEHFLNSSTKLFHSYTPPSTIERFFTKAWSMCLLPFGLWKILKNRDSNPLHGHTLSGIKKYYVSQAIPMKLLRDIRDRSNFRTHAILFSCLAAAIANHLKRRNSLTKEVTVLIPAPLQNLTKPIQLKNKYAVVSLKIPTLPPRCYNSKMGGKGARNVNSEDQTLSSLERLRIIQSVLEDTKGDPTFLSVHSLITAICSLMPARLAETLLSTKGSTLAFSNMPGPESTLNFDGDEIETLMFWTPIRDPMGAAVSLLSYNDGVRLGMALDHSLLTNEEEGDLIIQDFENEISNILLGLNTEERSIHEGEQLLKHIS